MRLVVGLGLLAYALHPQYTVLDVQSIRLQKQSDFTRERSSPLAEFWRFQDIFVAELYRVFLALEPWMSALGHHPLL